MLNYVVKLTQDATKIWKDDHDRLRSAGFDDKAILQITLIASRTVNRRRPMSFDTWPSKCRLAREL